jgi:hypothetical protein
MTVMSPLRRSPPPMMPIVSSGSASCSAMPLRHWRSSSIVGTITRVRTARRAIASKATMVLPAPVGKTTTPRPSARSHASTASR